MSVNDIKYRATDHAKLPPDWNNSLAQAPAGFFSMNGKYLPGAKAFRKFWAISLPFVTAFALVLVYGGCHHVGFSAT